MTEPVGNSPRGTPIPDNSLKARDETASKEQPIEAKKELSKIVEGKVTTRKPPWWKRAARSLIADDATNIGDFVLSDILIPAAKNLIRDIIVGGTDRTLFGSGRGRRGLGLRHEGPVSSLRTRYDRMSEEPSRGLTREQRARHDFQLITLDSRQEAIEVVEALIDQIVRFRVATVTDLYDLVGVTGSYADQRWGWTDLSTADIVQNRGGWLIDLPSPEPITR